MPIPKYQEMMLPLLRYLSDGEKHTTKELYCYLSIFFNLTEEEVKQKMLNRNRGIFYDRLGWAKLYLQKAKLIESVARSTLKITSRGKEVLEDISLSELSPSFLVQFPEFELFLRKATR